jgi:hypothetical protein
LARPESRVVG